MSLSRKNNTDGTITNILFTGLSLINIVYLRLGIDFNYDSFSISLQPLCVPASNLFAETMWLSKGTSKLSTSFLAVRTFTVYLN